MGQTATDPIWSPVKQDSGLSNFFIDLVHQSDDEHGLRQVLEQEVTIRSAEEARIQHRLVSAWANDTVTPGRVDSLDALFALDNLGLSTVARYWLAIAQGDQALVEQLSVELSASVNSDDLIEVGSVLARMQANLGAASVAEVAQLNNLAFDDTRLTNGPAWATLIALGETDSLPPMVLPQEFRSMHLEPERMVDAGVSELAAYPNPASDRVMLTLPRGVENGTLQVLDVESRILYEARISGVQPFAEVDVRKWATGLYIGRMLLEGMQVAEVKFNVVR